MTSNGGTDSQISQDDEVIDDPNILDAFDWWKPAEKKRVKNLPAVKKAKEAKDDFMKELIKSHPLDGKSHRYSIKGTIITVEPPGASKTVEEYVTRPKHSIKMKLDPAQGSDDDDDDDDDDDTDDDTAEE